VTFVVDRMLYSIDRLMKETSLAGRSWYILGELQPCNEENIKVVRRFVDSYRSHDPDEPEVDHAPEDKVNHPAHYGGADDPYEVIKVMRAWLSPEEYVGAMKFNIHKYLARAHRKGGAEDVAKAAWYARELDSYVREKRA
jgi:hypothetical protein